MDRVIYEAWLISVDDSDRAIFVGEYKKLALALVNARNANREKGVTNWDWLVDKFVNGTNVSRRSNYAGLENLE